MVKAFSDFSKASTCRDGFRNYCKECQSSKKKEWYAENKERSAQTVREWQKQNPEKVALFKQNWRDANKEYMSEYKKEYRRVNPDRINAHTAIRRKRVQQQTPLWVDKQALLEFYLACPEGFHVDHVVPLRGKTVSGLHIVNNLQYLPASENMKKGNKEMANRPT